VSNAGPVRNQLSNEISPKLGALLNVKSARTRAVMKDHMAKNFLALSSKGVSLFISDPCKRLFSYSLPHLAMATQFREKVVCPRLFQMASKSTSIFPSKELALAWWK